METAHLNKNLHLACYYVKTTDAESTRELSHIMGKFYGTVYVNDNGDDVTAKVPVLYLCGDIGDFFASAKIPDLLIVKIVRELSHNYDEFAHGKGSASCELITCGQVPLDMENGLGIYFRELFHTSSGNGNGNGYFTRLVKAHQFQTLTEGNKTGFSFRKGIYLSQVEQKNGEDINFNLLRCSTNLDGPTDNFRDVDHEILDKANEACDIVLRGHAPLNHVLAQIYENSMQGGTESVKDRKAKIKAHSDKTKDMPDGGVIAFATFYSDDLYDKAKGSSNDKFDYVYKNGSVLTTLRFKVKDCVAIDRNRPDLPKEFSVKLYNNSLFVIPLSTNRLYTHEIAPPTLPSDKIPTRLGYVIRCSKTQAVHRNGATYICNICESGDDSSEVELRQPSDKDRADLKDLYLKENVTDEIINYGDIYYSMNTGDYVQPII